MKHLLHALTLVTFCSASFSQTCDHPRANVILVIGDDLRYDAFQSTGGPSWFNTPAISRIGDEGANFSNYFCTYALCNPSRSSIITGLYPHSHGATDNFYRYNTDLPTIAEILHGAGYHTGMIGKFGASHDIPDGWDYWLIFAGNTDYIDANYKYGTEQKIIPGNSITIVTDSSLAYIASVDTPFFVTIGHCVPHRPVIPEHQYLGDFEDEQMPIPPTFYHYRGLYPSFLYDRIGYPDTARLVDDYEAYFEGLLGMEENMQGIFDILTERGLLDNTMIIFTSDNGNLYGEHRLAGKGVAYEPSMHLPLFIRYPAWFSPGTVVTDQFALNIDIAPTVVNAACLDETPYNFQGMPLQKLATGELKRDRMVFENIKLDHPDTDGDTSTTPSLRTLRSFSYKYTRYHCDNPTEEFFDLTVDPYEDHNLIYDPNYQHTIDRFRKQLDSMLIVVHDTLSSDTVVHHCHLVKVDPNAIQHSVGYSPLGFKLSPNPAETEVNLVVLPVSEGDIKVSFYNLLGTEMIHRSFPAGQGSLMTDIDVGDLPTGIYYVRISQDSRASGTFVFKE